MEKADTVSTIMTRNVITIQQDDSLFDVIKLIRKHRVRHLPVMEGKRLVGIISRNDINRLTFGALFDDQKDVDDSILNMLSIPQVMTANPKVVDAKDSIKFTAEILAHAEYHSLPVAEDGKLVGIVTTTDLLRYFVYNLQVIEG